MTFIFNKKLIKADRIISYYKEPIYINPHPEIQKKITEDLNTSLITKTELTTLFVENAAFFRKQKTKSKNECYSNAKITDLPITNKIIDGNDVWNQLDCDIADLESQDYIRLPDIDQVQVFIIGNFNYDDFIYNLVTIKDGKVILKKKIGFAIAESENSISEITEFQVNKGYVFLVTTKVKENGVFEKTKLEKFVINESGEIFTVN